MNLRLARPVPAQLQVRMPYRLIRAMRSTRRRRTRAGGGIPGKAVPEPPAGLPTAGRRSIRRLAAAGDDALGEAAGDLRLPDLYITIRGDGGHLVNLPMRESLTWSARQRDCIVPR